MTKLIFVSPAMPLPPAIAGISYLAIKKYLALRKSGNLDDARQFLVSALKTSAVAIGAGALATYLTVPHIVSSHQPDAKQALLREPVRTRSIPLGEVGGRPFTAHTAKL